MTLTFLLKNLIAIKNVLGPKLLGYLKCIVKNLKELKLNLRYIDNQIFLSHIGMQNRLSNNHRALISPLFPCAKVKKSNFYILLVLKFQIAVRPSNVSKSVF